MRPVKLIMTGFGAFPEKTEIDFSIPGEANLFLITGPTGAGKSTIFDAMSYALFGSDDKAQVRKPVDMYSHYLKNTGREAYVLFEFELGLMRYHVKRDVPYTVNGKQRAGKSYLRILDKAGKDTCPPITRVTEINDSVKAALGMTTEQFRQIVLLPQGDFQKFLLAKSSDREDILGKLFQTGLYERITEQLKQLAKEKQIKYSQLLAERNGLLSGKEVTTSEDLQAVIEKLQETFTEKEQQIPRVQKAFNNAAERLTNAQQEQNAFTEFKKLKEMVELHANGEYAINEKSAILKKAVKAENFKDTFARFQKMESLIAESKKVLAGLHLDVKKAEQQVALEQRELDRYLAGKQDNDKKKAEAERYIALLPKYEELANAEKEHQKLEQQSAELQKSMQKLTADNSTRETELSSISTLLKQLQEKVQAIPQVEAQVMRLVQAKADCTTIAQKQKELILIENKAREQFNDYTKLEDTAKAARATHEALEQQWRKNQAALLAVNLADGIPCPVCGSTEHPVPARATEKTVTTEAVELSAKNVTDLQNKVEAFRQQYSETQTIAARLQSSIEQIIAMLQPDLPSEAEVIEAQLKAEQQRLADLKQDAARCLQLEGEISTKQAEMQSVREKLQKIAEELSGLQANSGKVAGRIEALRADLPDGLQDVGQLQERIAVLQKHIVQFEENFEAVSRRIADAKLLEGKLQTQIAEKQSVLDSTHEDYQQLKEAINKSVIESGFSNRAEVESAFKTDAEQKALEEQVQSWKEKKAALHGQYEKAKETIKDKPEPDLVAAQHEKDRCDAELKSVLQECAKVQAQLNDFHSLYKRLEVLEKSLNDLSGKAAAYDELFKVASGINEKKQTLQTYILRTYLEDVLESSNKRLESLSAGRYELRVREEIIGGGKKGLELDVFDNYTGEQRPANTLSGGEMFLTSLALALGLADVVTMHSGAIKLDAIFIDEGFGSLDEQTLETAIEALKNLQQDGRMVGIISHVSELKERIPVKLEIIKGKRGSTVQWVM